MHRPNQMKHFFDAVVTDITASIDAINELIADHATSKTSVDAIETLVEELADDVTAMESYNHFMNEADGVVGGDWTITATAAATITGAGEIIYRIGGVRYSATLDTTITITDNAAAADIADGKFGAWRIVIDRLGAVTTQKAAADQQFDSAEAAYMNICTVDQTANTCCIGYLVGGDVGAAINIGTSNLSDWTTASIYLERGNRKKVTGLHTALGAATVATAGAATLAVGTIDVQLNGVRVAQIAADATDDLTDADLISTVKWGGWILCTDLAGTGTNTVPADGVLGAASTMAYTSQALVEAALDDVVDNMPASFCPLARVVVYNGTGGNFTGATTFWDAATVVTTVTDCTVGVWDKTSTTGLDSHKINPPAVGTVSSPDPASGPASMTETTITQEIEN